MKPSAEQSWIALAAIVPITLLITYHRVHDTKLLLLTIPACALLWAKRNRIGWVALLLTAAAIIVNADIPLAIFGVLIDRIHLSTTVLAGRLLTLFLARPAEELLFAMAVFYLWIYSSRSFSSANEWRMIECEEPQ